MQRVKLQYCTCIGILMPIIMNNIILMNICILCIINSLIANNRPLISPPLKRWGFTTDDKNNLFFQETTKSDTMAPS